MDVERKELREEKEGLREELQAITAKYHAMVDDYTVSCLRGNLMPSILTVDECYFIGCKRGYAPE